MYTWQTLRAEHRRGEEQLEGSFRWPFQAIADSNLSRLPSAFPPSASIFESLLDRGTSLCLEDHKAFHASQLVTSGQG